MLKQVGIGAAITAAIFLGVRFYGHTQHKAGYEQAQAEYMIAVGYAEGRARQIEHEMSEKMEVLESETQKQIEQITIAERSAANERVRSAAEEYGARYREATARATAAAERQAADTAIRMFAELLSELDEAAEIYAAEADRRRVAGLACEAGYAGVKGGS